MFTTLGSLVLGIILSEFSLKAAKRVCFLISLVIVLVHHPGGPWLLSSALLCP